MSAAVPMRKYILRPLPITDADIVMFLHREAYYGNDDGQPVNQHKAQCIIAKNRHGETATVDLHWDGQFTKFSAQDGLR